jgi:hypothetical protein
VYFKMRVASLDRTATRTTEIRTTRVNGLESICRQTKYSQAENRATGIEE